MEIPMLAGRIVIIPFLHGKVGVDGMLAPIPCDFAA
jgi:hypothetical protein